MRALLALLAVVLLPCRSMAEEGEEATRLAVEALAERIGVDPDSLSVESVEPVQWTSSSSACSQWVDEQASLQSTGYRVLVRTADKLYPVHVAGEKAVICSKGFAVASAPQETSAMSGEKAPELRDASSQALVSRARDDLAQRLGVAAAEVKLIAFQSVVWPDGSLGCPQPGREYPQVLQDGVLIRFEVHGRQFEYHGGGRREPFLCENPSPPVQGQSER